MVREIKEAHSETIFGLEFSPDGKQIASCRADRFAKIFDVVLRDDESKALDVPIGSIERDGTTVGFLGVGIGNAVADYWYLRKFGPLQSIAQSVERTWNSTAFTIRMLGRMVTGEVSIKNISGPINIGQIAGESAQRGARFCTSRATPSAPSASHA